MSVETPFIKISKDSNLSGGNSISFRDIGNIYPYIEKNGSPLTTVTDYDGVWKRGLLSSNSWKNDPDISYAFKQVIEKTDDLYIVTARIKSKRISMMPFISEDNIEEMHSHVETINPSCRLSIICGLEKVLEGQVSHEIIMRNVDKKNNVGVFVSSLRDEFLTRKTYNALNPNDRRLMTSFSTGCLFI